MSAELIIFDCDGVLIDSELISCRSSASSLAEVGIAITADEILERYVGGSTAAMIADLEGKFGPLPPGFVEGARQRLATAFDAELRAVPGINEALACIGRKICVASSSAPERLRHTLSLVGLLHHFDPHIFSSTQVRRGKPAPDLFLFAASQMGFDPTACVVVEDSVAGVTAAVAAGMRVIGFTGGSHCRPDHADRLRQAGAVEIIANHRELPARLVAARITNRQ